MTLTPQTFHFEDDAPIPNSPLPVLVYHGVPDATGRRRCGRLFPADGWLGAWQNRIYSFHHFHSIAHEVLGVVAGSATVMLGGSNGRELEINPGDALTSQRYCTSTPTRCYVPSDSSATKDSSNSAQDTASA